MKLMNRLSIVAILMMLAMLVAPGVGYAAGTTSASGTVANKTQTGASHAIVFQMSSGGAIYAVNPDGRSLRYLTTGMDPALSPDGQAGGLHPLGRAGQRRHRQPVGDQRRRHRRAPGSGGREPAQVADLVGGWQADHHQHATGRQAVRLLSLHDRRQARSRCERSLEGQRCRPPAANPYWGLRLIDVATGAYEDLPGETHSFAPTWDPANAWHVVFRGDKGLESLDLNLGTTWMLASNGAYRGPVFSPDGSKIAVTFKQNDHWEVHVMNADGTGEVRLTETPSSVIVDAMLAGQDCPVLEQRGAGLVARRQADRLRQRPQRRL